MWQKGNKKETCSAEFSSLRRSQRLQKITSTDSSIMNINKPSVNVEGSLILKEDAKEKLVNVLIKLTNKTVIVKHVNNENTELEQNVAQREEDISEKSTFEEEKQDLKHNIMCDKPLRKNKNSEYISYSLEKYEGTQLVDSKPFGCNGGNVHENEDAELSRNRNSLNEVFNKKELCNNNIDLGEQDNFNLNPEKIDISNLKKQLYNAMSCTDVDMENGNDNDGQVNKLIVEFSSICSSSTNAVELKTSTKMSPTIESSVGNTVCDEEAMKTCQGEQTSENNILLSSNQFVDSQADNTNIDKDHAEPHDLITTENIVSKKLKNEFEKDDVNSKIDELLANVEYASSVGSSAEGNAFIETMAEEGEEDTPSEGSNDIIEVGEEINTTESELSSDESYDRDSFIDDEENHQLLSGEEYDLYLEESNKRKRILSLSSGSDDIIVHIKRTEKKVFKKLKKSRILKNLDSSDDEPVDPILEVNPQENWKQNNSNDDDEVGKTEECEKNNSNEYKKYESDGVGKTEETKENYSNESEKYENDGVSKTEEFNTSTLTNGNVNINSTFENMFKADTNKIHAQSTNNDKKDDTEILHNEEKHQQMEIDDNNERPCKISTPATLIENSNKKIIILENIRIPNIFNKNLNGLANTVPNCTNTEIRNISRTPIDSFLNSYTSSIDHEKNASTEIHHQPGQDIFEINEDSMENLPLGTANNSGFDDSNDLESIQKDKKVFKKKHNNSALKASGFVKKHKKNINNRVAEKNTEVSVGEKTISQFQKNQHNELLGNPKLSIQENTSKQKYNTDFIKSKPVKRKKKNKSVGETPKKSDLCVKMNILDEAILQQNNNSCILRAMSDEDWNSNVSVKSKQISKKSSNANPIKNITQTKVNNSSKYNTKNFKDLMLYNNCRVKRMETKQLLNKKVL